MAGAEGDQIAANARSTVARVSTAGNDRAEVGVVTWHRGLIARWWANFNVDGPEIAFFRAFVPENEPALDAACGTGRLLLPWLDDGLDVDGVDASADMISACHTAALGRGHNPKLFVQPLHRLRLPRTYRTIVLCGGFGLGVSRAHDAAGLGRMLAHLRPGGVLALDFEVEGAPSDVCGRLRPGRRDASLPEAHDRRRAADGFEYALRSRIAAVDVDDRNVTHEMQVWQWRDGQLLAYESHLLTANLYSSGEIAAALLDVGFTDVEIIGGYHGRPPTDDEQFVCFIATAPRPPRAGRQSPQARER